MGQLNLNFKCLKLKFRQDYIRVFEQYFRIFQTMIVNEWKFREYSNY